MGHSLTRAELGTASRLPAAHVHSRRPSVSCRPARQKRRWRSSSCSSLGAATSAFCCFALNPAVAFRAATSELGVHSVRLALHAIPPGWLHPLLSEALSNPHHSTRGVFLIEVTNGAYDYLCACSHSDYGVFPGLCRSEVTPQLSLGKTEPRPRRSDRAANAEER